MTIEKLSIKVTKYLKPSSEVYNGLHTSECISSNAWVTSDTKELKGSLNDLEKWQISHSRGFLVGNEFTLLKIELNGCPRQRCHKSGSYDVLKLAWNPLETRLSWEK